MTADPFGNLRDWGPVLDTLEQLFQNGRLDDCQPGLIRILRYQGNWRLREEALKRVVRIARPGRPLIDQVMHIVADDNLYYEVRILGARALVALMAQYRRLSPAGVPVAEELPVAEKLRHLLDVPQPPFFSQALHTCLHGLNG